MLSFIAFQWDTNDEVADVASARIALGLGSPKRGEKNQWHCEWESQGLRILSRDSGGAARVVRIPDSQGLVMGTLFRSPHNGESGPVASFSAAESKQIRDTRGVALVDNYWGTYVGFIRTADAGWRVIRGPMSPLPVYQYRLSGLTILFSRLADFLEAVPGLQLSVNWRFVLHDLQGSLQSSQTGVSDVHELLPGRAWTFSKQGVVEDVIWKPLEHLAGEMFTDSATAEQSLRESIRACTQSWAACFRHVGVRLSGGLDSSIVLSCLADAPNRARITCINGYREGARSDERPFARIAAEQASADLVEVMFSVEEPLERMMTADLFPFPPQTINSICSGPAEEGAMRPRGVEAMFNGLDGDGLFGRTMLRYSVIDDIAARGVAALFGTTVLDAARVRHQSVWRVLANALKDWRTAGALPQKVRAGSFLKPGIFDDVPSSTSLSDWVRFARQQNLPLGTANYSHGICNRMGAFYPAFSPAHGGRPPHEVSPLCAQPVIETAMRTPLPMLTASQGARWDRPLARRAFRRDLPQPILFRREKGAVVDHTATLLRNNRDFLKTLLLDGVLAQRGLLDIRLLADVLSPLPKLEHRGLAQIFRLASIEAWARAIHASSLTDHAPALDITKSYGLVG